MAALNGQDDMVPTDRPWRGRAHVYTQGGALGGTPAKLSQFLLHQRPRRFHFIGHGDVNLGGQMVLGFTGPTGELQVVNHATLAGIFSPVASSDGLRLVVLNACQTEDLGMRLHQAGVPVVVCWRTSVEDTAGRIFGTAFHDACAQGISERDAFNRAAQAVRLQLRPGHNGALRASVPMFELRDPAVPADPALGYTPLPAAAGVPLLICADGVFLPNPPPP
jgi:hypothetical protein